MATKFETSDSTLDFRNLFQAVPGLCLVLRPDFTIAAAGDAYLSARALKREALIGRDLFAAFPGDPAASAELRVSLERVLETRATDQKEVEAIQLHRPQTGGPEIAGALADEEWHWNQINSPILDENGAVTFILHRMEDVTDAV